VKRQQSSKPEASQREEVTASKTRQRLRQSCAAVRKYGCLIVTGASSAEPHLSTPSFCILKTLCMKGCCNKSYLSTNSLASFSSASCGRSVNERKSVPKLGFAQSNSQARCRIIEKKASCKNDSFRKMKLSRYISKSCDYV